MPGRHRRPVPAAPRPSSVASRLLLPVLAALVVVAVVVVPIAWLAARLRDDVHPAAQRSLSSTGPTVTVAPSPTPTVAAPGPTPARPAPTGSPRSTATTSTMRGRLPVLAAGRPRELATLQLWITGDASWVHVSSPARLLAERRMVHGETAYFVASQLFAVLGNAGAVTVSVNGAPMRLAGEMGQAVRGTIKPG